MILHGPTGRLINYASSRKFIVWRSIQSFTLNSRWRFLPLKLWINVLVTWTWPWLKFHAQPCFWLARRLSAIVGREARRAMFLLIFLLVRMQRYPATPC